MRKNEIIEISEYLDQIGEHELADQYANRFAANVLMTKEAGFFGKLKHLWMGWKMEPNEVEKCSELIQELYADLIAPKPPAPAPGAPVPASTSTLSKIAQAAKNHKIIYMPSMYSAPGAHVPQNLEAENRPDMSGGSAGAMDVRAHGGPEDEVDRYYATMSGGGRTAAADLKQYLIDNKILKRDGSVSDPAYYGNAIANRLSRLQTTASSEFINDILKISEAFNKCKGASKSHIDFQTEIYKIIHHSRASGRYNDPHGLNRLVNTAPENPNSFLSKASAPTIMRYVSLMSDSNLDQQFGSTYYNLYRSSGGNIQDLSNIGFFLKAGYTIGACEQGRFIPSLTG